MIRAVFFDLDGTLFDRPTTVLRCIEEQHRRFSHVLSAVPAHEYVSRFVDLDARGYTGKDVVYAQLAGLYRLSQEDTAALFDDFYSYYHRCAVGYAGVAEVLRTQRSSGLLLGVITNGGGAHQRATLAAIGLTDHLDAVLISEVEGVRKPDARIFRRALERCGVSAEEAVFVGDHPETDVAGARNAGLLSIWKRDRYWADHCDADGVVDDVREIPAMLRRLARKPAGT